MRGHNDECVCAEVFLVVTEAQAVGDDLARAFADEDRQPIYNTERAEIKRGVGMDSVALHG